MWELRHREKAGVISPIKNCGYTDAELASLRKCGYRLYHDGKAVKAEKDKK